MLDLLTPTLLVLSRECGNDLYIYNIDNHPVPSFPTTSKSQGRGLSHGWFAAVQTVATQDHYSKAIETLTGEVPLWEFSAPWRFRAGKIIEHVDDYRYSFEISVFCIEQMIVNHPKFEYPQFFTKPSLYISAIQSIPAGWRPTFLCYSIYRIPICIHPRIIVKWW